MVLLLNVFYPIAKYGRIKSKTNDKKEFIIRYTLLKKLIWYNA